MLRPVHFEIQADNLERAAKFYTDVFGWNITKWENPHMEYWMVMTGPKDDASPGIHGGLLPRPCPVSAEPSGTNAFVCTMDVPSVDEYLEKIVKAGGKVAMPKFALAGMAWQAYGMDTEGNTFGIHQTDPNAA